jgi:predicted metal-dependent hydrolase
LTVPSRLPSTKINEILKEENQWFEEQLLLEQELLSRSKLYLPKELSEATEFPYLGEMIPFSIQRSHQESRLEFSENRLILWAKLGREVENEMYRLLQENLENEMLPLIRKWTEQLSVRFTKLRWSNAKRRWGSCSSQGTLSFNWRLIFAPRFVIESVVIHEVCHLIELNHGPGFHHLEQNFNTSLEESDRWLKGQGPAVLTFAL